MLVRVDLDIDVPAVPNFINSPDRVNGRAIDIAEISDDDLRKIGEAWTEKLLKHAQNRRKQPAGQR